MKIQVLDHGYVELIECWGTGKDGVERFEGTDVGPYQLSDIDYEVGIIEAARQSTQGSFRGWYQADCDCQPHNKLISGCLADCASRRNPGDAKLLRRLWTHNHSTPFEFAGMVIEVQAPIMVFREWHRHRSQSYNEASARYAPLPDLYYHADPANVWNRAFAAQTTSNKQAAGTSILPLDKIDIADWLREDEKLSAVLEAHYQRGLKIGIPKELARKKMPVDHYTKMRASANLRNWLGFMTLRCDLQAQWEIRQYAHAIFEIIGDKFPRTADLWAEIFHATAK